MRKLGLVMMCGLSACSGEPQAAKGTVTFGAPVSSLVKFWRESLDLAIEDVNEGIKASNAWGSFQVGVTYGDTSIQDPVGTVALASAVDLVHKQGAKAIITDINASALSINGSHYDNDPSNDLNVPIICNSCGSEPMNNPNGVDPDPVMQATIRNQLGWNFRAMMSDSIQRRAAMSLILSKGNHGDVNGDGQFKISIYTSDSPIYAQVVKDMQQFAMELHPSPPPLIETILFKGDANPNSPQFQDDVIHLVDNENQSTGMADGYPDAIWEASYPPFTDTIINTFAQTGSAITFFHDYVFRGVAGIIPQSLTMLAAGPATNEGTSVVAVDNTPSGAKFQEELMTRKEGVLISGSDAQLYDAGVLMSLATLVAVKGMADPSQVTGAQIRDALHKVNEPNGTHVGTGPDELKKAAMLISQGMPINYDGASGPCDIDAQGNVLDRVSHWVLDGTSFKDVDLLDCVADPINCPLVK